MPEFEFIEYTRHARERMCDRRITPDEVEIALRFGDGRPGGSGTWVYELQSGSAAGIRVIVKEFNSSARVVTVIRLRKHS